MLNSSHSFSFEALKSLVSFSGHIYRGSKGLTISIQMFILFNIHLFY